MSTLFVTSFSKPVFLMTGHALIESFIRSGTDGTLLVCHEGFGTDPEFLGSKLLSYDLAQSTMLRDWLESSADIIPTDFGGKALPCACPAGKNPFGTHKQKCPWGWFNRNTLRWFRKVIALSQAARLTQYDTLIWLDCDCVFHVRLPGRIR
jgi:hypothetical protein